MAFTVGLNSCKKQEVISAEAELSSQYDALLSSRMTAFEVFTLDYNTIFNHVKSNLSGTFELNLNIPAHPEWNFTCTEDDMSGLFAEDFKAYEIQEGNRLVEVQLPEMIVLEAYSDVSTVPSVMSFSIGRMEAMIFIGEEEYYLEPVFNYDQNAPEDVYVLYRASDAFVTENPVCTDGAADQRTGVSHGGGQKTNVNCWKVEITYLGDYQFYNSWSSNKSTNSWNWMHNRWLYGMKRYYQYNGYPLDWLKKTAYLYTTSNSTPSSYSDKNAFIAECSAFYNYSWYNEGDCNMFWTGYNVSGVWGKADGIGRMCGYPAKAFAFGEKMPTTTQSNNLMAHEVGHSMACYHDNSINNFMHSNYNNWNSYAMGQNAQDDLTDHFLNYGGSCLDVDDCD